MSESFTVTVLFRALDLGDPEVLEALFNALPQAVPAEIDGSTTVLAKIEAADAEAAAFTLADRVTNAVPVAVPVRVDQDLVAISDIAERIGRSRESVRLLVEGKRGPGSFPAPVGVVGDSIRVWPWAVVVEWCNMELGKDLGERGIMPEEAAVVDACLAARKRARTSHHSASVRVSDSRPTRVHFVVDGSHGRVLAAHAA